MVIINTLHMRGLIRLYPGEGDPSGRFAVDAIKAGDNVLMVPGNVTAAYNAILGAVKIGEIPESRVDASVRRILEMKAALGLNNNRFVDVNRVQEAFSNPAANEFAQQVSDASVTLVRNNRQVLPLISIETRTAANERRGKLVVIIVADSRRSRLGPLFESELKLRRPDAQVFHYYNDHMGSDAPWKAGQAAASADPARIRLCWLFSRRTSWADRSCRMGE